MLVLLSKYCADYLLIKLGNSASLQPFGTAAQVYFQSASEQNYLQFDCTPRLRVQTQEHSIGLETREFQALNLLPPASLHRAGCT